jgi:hypothetical protein
MLREILTSRKEEILRTWLDLIFESYPPNGRAFLKSERNEFHNPVGHCFREGTSQLLEGLIKGVPLEEMEPALDRIVRIRAVQDCTASEATVFVFSLKEAIRRELVAELGGESIRGEMTVLESTIDKLAQAAFDTYAGCKQRIFDIQVRAERAKWAMLLERTSRQDAGGAPAALPSALSQG